MPEPTPTPGTKVKKGLKDIREWWDKGVAGEFVNPRSLGYDEDTIAFVRERGVPGLIHDEYQKFKLMEGWDAEDIVERDPPPTPTATPTATMTPTMDDALAGALGIGGQSAKNYQNQ